MENIIENFLEIDVLVMQNTCVEAGKTWYKLIIVLHGEGYN